MQETKQNTTAGVLAAMLTENTGTHMLDSGGHYGRHWQENKGVDFESTPRAWVDDNTATLNVYHWLNDNLEYAPELDAQFQEYAQGNDASHMETMQSFISEVLGLKRGDMYENNTHGGVFNTYNWENNLSQTLQGLSFDLNGTSYLLLQIHGGADVRGGYTRPRAFEIVGEPYFYYDDNISLRCTGKDRHSFHGSDREWYDYDSGECYTYNQMSDENNKYKCPNCASSLVEGI
jgi:hypothetical protein